MTGHGMMTAAAAPMKWVRYSTPAWLLWTQLGWLTIDITPDGWAIMALLPAPTADGGYHG